MIPFDVFMSQHVSSLPKKGTGKHGKTRENTSPTTIEGKEKRKNLSRGHGYHPAKIRLVWMMGDPCAYCGDAAGTWDHLTPRKRGGTHSDDNLARVCQSCNHEKTSRILLMFLTIRAQRKAAGTWKKMPTSSLHSHGQATV